MNFKSDMQITLKLLFLVVAQFFAQIYVLFLQLKRNSTKVEKSLPSLEASANPTTMVDEAVAQNCTG